MAEKWFQKNNELKNWIFHIRRTIGKVETNVGAGREAEEVSIIHLSLWRLARHRAPWLQPGVDRFSSQSVAAMGASAIASGWVSEWAMDGDISGGKNCRQLCARCSSNVEDERVFWVGKKFSRFLFPHFGACSALHCAKLNQWEHVDGPTIINERYSWRWRQLPAKIRSKCYKAPHSLSSALSISVSASCLRPLAYNDEKIWWEKVQRKFIECRWGEKRLN